MTGSETSMITDGAMTHVASGAAVVYFLQWLKLQGWCKWITVDTKTLNRIVSAIAAGLIALGVTWSGNASEGWTAHIPPAMTLLAGAGEWLKQFVLQQLIYDGIVQKSGSDQS